MAEISRPWQSTAPGDAGPYSSSNWHDIYKYLFHALNVNAGPIKDSGTSPNVGLHVQATAPASASVDVLPGAALVEGVFYVSDGTETFAVAANLSGNPRIDTIVLAKDYVAQTVRLSILTGTTAASPVPPTLTQTDGVLWHIPIADIAVASGFVTITDSNITPRYEWANAADGVYLYGVLNNSGVTLQTGDVVIWDSTANRAVTTTTLLDDAKVAGVWIGRTLNGAYGRVQKSGIGLVKVGAAVTRGSRIGTDTTATQAKDLVLHGKLGTALLAAGGAGLLVANIDIQPQEQYMCFQDQKAQNTDGGTFTSGAWRVRDLNTTVANPSSIASLGANQVTLPAGTYRCWIQCPAYAVNKHQARLYDTTGAAALVYGSSQRNPSTVNQTSSSIIIGRFTLAVQSVLQVEHQCETTDTTDGFGIAANFGTEVYTTAEFWRE